MKPQGKIFILFLNVWSDSEFELFKSSKLSDSKDKASKIIKLNKTPEIKFKNFKLKDKIFKYLSINILFLYLVIR